MPLSTLCYRFVGARLKLPSRARYKTTRGEGRLKVADLLISVTHFLAESRVEKRLESFLHATSG